MAAATYCSGATWTYLRVLQRTGLLRRMNVEMKARVLGKTVRIPVVEELGLLALQVGEPWADRLFPVLMHHFPGTFVDVGVNIGQTLTKVRSIDPSVPYVGFEPNPACIKYSRELAQRNGWANTPIVPAGLAEQDGLIDLLMINDDPADPAASIVSDFRPGIKVHRRIPVALLSFATVERTIPIPPIGVIKIDVEGAEREVLLSLRERIAKDRPAIFLEILPVGVKAQAQRLQRQQDIESLFAALHYKLVRIHNKGEASRLEVMEGPIGIHDDQDLANFVILPGERLAQELPRMEQAFRHK